VLNIILANISSFVDFKYEKILYESSFEEKNKKKREECFLSFVYPAC